MERSRYRSRLLPGARETPRNASATSGMEKASSVAMRRYATAALAFSAAEAAPSAPDKASDAAPTNVRRSIVIADLCGSRKLAQCARLNCLCLGLLSRARYCASRPDSAQEHEPSEYRSARHDLERADEPAADHRRGD